MYVLRRESALQDKMSYVDKFYRTFLFFAAWDNHHTTPATQCRAKGSLRYLLTKDPNVPSVGLYQRHRVSSEYSRDSGRNFYSTYWFIFP